MTAPDHKNREHAPFAPSGAERWLNCAAAVRYAEQLPPQADTPSTDFGTRCHQISEKAIRGDLDDVTIRNLCEEQRDQWARQWSVEPGDDDDMADVVFPYVRYVRDRTTELRQLYGDAVVRRIEERVTIVGKDCWGSLDCSWFVPFVLLEVADLKGGKGKCVDPEENEQLLTYAVGEAERNDWLFEEFILTIVQPRRTDGRPAVTNWPGTTGALRTHQKRVKAAVKAGKDLRALPTAGDWCGWCVAKGVCPAQRERAVAVLDTLDAEPLQPVVLPDVGAMTPEQMARVLEASGPIEKWFDAVRALALTRPPPGFKVVASNTKRRWTADAEEALRVAGVLSDLQTTKLVGIGDAEKVLQLLAPDLIPVVFEKPPGKPTLAPVSDKRPAINPAGALEALGDE